MRASAEKLMTLEFYSLCLLAFSLPLIEPLKHIACLLYLIIFSLRAIRYRDSLPSCSMGNYILFFIGGSSIAAIGAASKGYEILKLHDIIRYSLVGWMILYTPLSKKQIHTIIYLLIFSSIIGIIYGYYNIENGTKKSFELHSVGHINHSVIYLLLTIGITISLLLKRSTSKAILLSITFINLLLIIVLLDSNSRAAAIGLIVLLIIFMITAFINYKRIFYSLLVLTLITTSYLIWKPPHVIHKFIHHNKIYSDKLSPRERIWNTAFYVWKKEPIFGVGYGNYRTITPKKVSEWYKENGINFSDKAKFSYSSHTHNRYINTLVEGGIIGFISLLILLWGIIRFLWQQRKLAIRQETAPYWLMGTNTLAILGIVGMFNTTLHHEHGLLAMVIISLSFRQLSNHKTQHDKTTTDHIS